MASEKKTGGKFRVADFLVVLLCLSASAYSINMFRLDLFQTLNGQNKTPIGSVSIKRNTVQRRMSDRVVWDRLIKESLVYSDDIIRVADNSEADLHVSGNDISLNENTLVRLHYDKESGEFKIELTTGNMGLVTANEGGNVVLNIMGRQVEARPGTALNAAAGNSGMTLQVSEGAAVIADEGQNRELSSGGIISMDSEGAIRLEPAAMIIQPRPNAIYIKSAGEMINISFSWNRINLQPDETLRLEIAEDQSFSRSVRALDGLNSSAQTALNAGLWNWRLVYNSGANSTILSSGRFTITEASAPELLSPARNQQFIYETDLPKLNFQWSQTEDASHYIIEVDSSPDFRNPVIKKQSAVTSLSDSSLTEGNWYWRVTPVFSQAGEGGVNARVSSFSIVRKDEPASAPITPSQPSRVTLELPNNDASLPGLTALRQQTVFRWSSTEAVAKSRFVLSRNSNPLTGQAAVEIPDPNRTIRLDRLEEGVWYWTVEAQTPDGADITAQSPRQLRVLPIPRLSAPENRQPATGQRIGIEELKTGSINFRWSAVSGANAYIFTLYQEADGRRKQIAQIGPENRTSWAAEVKTLGRGNFIWQVEAVNMGRNNVIEQRGNLGENNFVIDIPRAGPVKIIDGSEALQ
ncbi:FecR family protein [Treponema sp. R80B11-R83G3]